MEKTSWIGRLEDSDRCIVEQVAVRYDTAWRSGWLSEDGLWKNPYCEGMIDVLSQMNGDEFFIRRCVAEYCCKHGYIPMRGQRPEWLEEHMEFIDELWAQEEAQGRKDWRNPLVESRRKLQDWLRQQGFEVHSGPHAIKQWLLVDGSGQSVNIEVRAHRDGRQADYVVCNAHWVPIQ